MNARPRPGILSVGETTMIIHGLQKMTLLDYPGKVAATVFLGGCDLRCPFCHNAELLDGTVPGVMDDEELLRFLKSRRGLLDGVAVTGGEPLLRRDLPDLLRRIRGLGYPVKLDTNGTHPDLLNELIAQRLVDYVAMDVKNDLPRYGQTAGLDDFDPAPVKASIGILLEGRCDYEFRTTVVDELHDEDSFRGIGPLIAGARRYFLQAFTDRESVPFEGFHAPSRERLEAYRQIVLPFVPATSLRGV